MTMAAVRPASTQDSPQTTMRDLRDLRVFPRSLQSLAGAQAPVRVGHPSGVARKPRKSRMAPQEPTP